MPPSYGVGNPKYGFEPISWEWVIERMESARGYWISTVAADGSPRAAPVWGVWADGGFHFFTDADSLKARNLARDRRAVVHTESADDVVILEGTMEFVQPSAEVVRAYEAKYAISLGDPPPAACRLPPANRQGAGVAGVGFSQDGDAVALWAGWADTR